MPPFCIKNREVTRMNAAHPFMLMVVQIGNTNRDTLLDTPILVSAVFMVTGRVAAELFVKSAINTAGIILLSVRTGLMPLANSGWFGFNPGSQLAASGEVNRVAISHVFLTTNLAAVCGGLQWYRPRCPKMGRSR